MQIALVGCGAIGSGIAKAIADKKINAKLELVADKNPEAASKICSFFLEKPKISTIDEIIFSDVKLVIEAAAVEVAKEIALPVVKSKKDMMVMSIGALAEKTFFEKLEKTAAENQVKVYLPSGAIGGLDALSSASVAKIKDVLLVTTKSPKSLGLELKEKKILFEGNSGEAIEKFPKNINVAVTLALAGIGVEKTKVKIIVDPNVKQNIHEIFVEGEFGNFYFKTENLPTPENPRTSYLATLSAIALLKKIISPIQIG